MERIGVGFNPNLSAEEIADYSRLADLNGYDSFWVHEQPFIKDAVSLLARVIMSTKRIRVGSGCISVVTRHPLLAASTFVSLNDRAGGRVTMGVGLGGFPWLPKIGVKVFLVEETKPIRRIVEFLTISRALLNGNSVCLDGEFFKVKEIKLDSKPAIKPRLYLASFGSQLLSIAARLVDGVIISPSMMTPEITKQKVPLVKTDKTNIDIASYILTAVSKDAAEASQLMKSYYFFIYQVAEVIKPEIFEPYDLKENDLEEVKRAWLKKDLIAAGKAMPDEVLEALTLTGEPDQCLDRMKDYRRSGIKLPIIMPIGDVKTALETFRPS